jgi:hypothetical protein
VKYGEAEKAQARVKEGGRLCMAGRGAQLASDACPDAIGRSGGGIECGVESGVRRKARLAWERTVSVKTRGFG